jgi:hypothetical protein
MKSKESLIIFLSLYLSSTSIFNAPCQKVPFVLARCQASAAPRPENSHSDEKDALFGLDTVITVLNTFFSFRDQMDFQVIRRVLIRNEVRCYFLLYNQ